MKAEITKKLNEHNKNKGIFQKLIIYRITYFKRKYQLMGIV